MPHHLFEHSSFSTMYILASKSKGKMTGKTVTLEELQGGIGELGSWAQLMDEHGGYAQTDVTEIVKLRQNLPNAPASLRDGMSHPIDMSRVPNDPPFKIFIGNVDYYATDPEVIEVFRDTRVLLQN